MLGVLSASTTILRNCQFFRCIGLVSFSNVVEMATLGAFQA